MCTARYHISRGDAYPMGANFDGDGVNFAVFSAHAEKIELCLFSADGCKEVQRLTLPERQGDIWHGYVPGLHPGVIYGLRAHGPYQPQAGHRFNANKLLLDPYARKIHGAVNWSDSLMGYQVGSAQADLSFDTRDSAAFMPKAIVQKGDFDWRSDEAPKIPVSKTVIYEAHVKGLTAGRTDLDPAMRGTFLGLSSDVMLEYLTKLGITAVELLPPQAFVNDLFLAKKNLRNYWGYQTIGFFAPEPRYLSKNDICEFQTMVRRFHSAGIEVLIDVVYNHTAEGSELGPTLSFRGLDNQSYYLLEPHKPRHYRNYTGTGNTLNMDHPMVMRMVMDSLRYWVETMHVDGFRFDLAVTLGRTSHGFNRRSALLKAIKQDPVLAKVKLIAEPWDIGPHGYQLGAFASPFLEWNDKYRDAIRSFWKGDAHMTSELAERLVGSAAQFDHAGRRPTASVNFVTAHDGFTLQDVVSYNRKHNAANFEDNLDGHNNNHSANLGVEGVSDDPKIISARNRRKRNLLATMFLSQGTPMLLAGDEIGNSQAGNNNAYCQDNEVGWVNWADADTDLLAFVQKLIALRKTLPVLRQARFLHSNLRKHDGQTDLFWRLPDGASPGRKDWHDPDWRTLCVELRSASDSAPYEVSEDVIFVVFNGGNMSQVVLPDCLKGKTWHKQMDTANPLQEGADITANTIEVAENSVVLLSMVSRP